MSDHAPADSSQRAKVFISYRREDSAGHTGRLFDRITNYFGDRIEIFMDVDSIAPGEDFISVIDEAVGECEILVVVIGRDWLTITDENGKRRLDNPEDFVRVEIAAALNRDIRVIPVLVQGATMPRREQLPEALTKLTRRNAIEVSDARWKYDVDRLIKTIEEVSSLQPATAGKTPAQTPAEPTAMSSLRSWRVLVPTLGVVVLLGLGVWLLKSRGGSANVSDNKPPLSNSGNTEPGKTQPNISANGSNGDNTNGAANTGAGANVSSDEPPAVTGTQTGVQVVRINVEGKFSSQGFFTSKGYIVAFVGEQIKPSDEVTVTWAEGGHNYNEIAQAVDVKSMTALFKLKNRGLMPHRTPIRLSNSLQKGEAVERFIGPDDTTPGSVLEINAEGMLGVGKVLVTTKISFAGDAGAPVVDSQGRVVAMVMGGNQTQTQSLPIEKIKLMFPDAF